MLTPHKKVDIKGHAAAPAGARGLRSLWDVLETEAWHLINHGRALGLLCEDLRRRLRPNAQGGPSGELFGEEDRENFLTILGDLEPWLRQLALDASLDRLRRLRFTIGDVLSDDGFTADSEVLSQTTVFLESMEDELKRRVFLTLTPEEATFYQSPYRRFPKTVRAFPSAEPDILGASQCYALGQATACVFHCMGIVQRGLHALAVELRVQFNWPVEMENWQTIIQQIEKKIKDLEGHPKSLDKDARLKTYSEIALQFRYFKDAWRNHVCHYRASYDIHQARSVLTHVTDFMELISDWLYELPQPEKGEI